MSDETMPVLCAYANNTSLLKKSSLNRNFISLKCLLFDVCLFFKSYVCLWVTWYSQGLFSSGRFPAFSVHVWGYLVSWMVVQSFVLVLVLTLFFPSHFCAGLHNSVLATEDWESFCLEPVLFFSCMFSSRPPI